MPRSIARVFALVIAFVTIAIFVAPSASGVARPPRPGTRSGTNTEMTMVGTGPGHGVTGFIANTDNPFDPVTEGYPTSNPTTGFSPKDEGFAGVIIGRPSDGSPDLTLYCIDIFTDTYPGIGYGNGSWDAANVPNVGYVARILNSYYPANPDQPAGLSAADKAAAVQAAIWFFSDRYVLSTSDPMHDTAAAIVAATIAAGPLVQPPPPSLTIAPTAASGPAGSILGPFTVSAAATATATGADMFSDAGATSPIANGTSVPAGQRIWLKSSGPAAAVLEATAKATVPTGNVYLYDGNTPGVNDAQKLILSQTATLTTTVKATAEFQAPGSLTVTKTIRGPAAGQQGEVTIVVTCDGTALSPTLTIAAGTPAGNSSHTYLDIPAGSVCTIDETVDGHTSTVEVTVVGGGQEVTIPSGDTATADITDIYRLAPASLIVKKTISGNGAGKQGEVTIHTVCGGTALIPDFTVPAGAIGEPSKQYDNLPAGSNCTITETVDGHNTSVSVTVTGNGRTVTLPPGGIEEVHLTDDYTLNPGSLTVTKTINGTGAGQQGAIEIVATCINGGDAFVLVPPFTIAAGAAPGDYSHTYTDIPAGSVCHVIETQDGHTATRSVIKRGSGTEVTIPPGGEETVPLVDTYETGDLVVNKTIFGDAAGSQGEVVIHTVCNGTALAPDLVIPPTSDAGTYSQSYPGVLAGGTCTVTETANGATTTVTVTTTGNGQDVTISGNGTGTADLTDDYEFVPGALTVTKTIAGPSAGDQGEVTIQVDCGPDVDTPDFVIPAGAAGAQSHTYAGVPAGTTCTVTETVDGSSRTVDVTVGGSPKDVTIGANETATVDITDTYTAAPGALVVGKTITGPFAGNQGPITIAVTCGGTALPTFDISAGTTATTLFHSYQGIPAGSTCTVTETRDGTTQTAKVIVDTPTQDITVPAGRVVFVHITDTINDTPGTLVVVKQITGPAAGQQGQIGILALCGGPVNVFVYLIPATTAEGSVSRAFNTVPADSTCQVIEARDGQTSTVSATRSGTAQHVTVPAAAVVPARIVDTFTPTSQELPATGPRQVAPLLEVGVLAIIVGLALLAAGRASSRRRRG